MNPFEELLNTMRDFVNELTVITTKYEIKSSQIHEKISVARNTKHDELLYLAFKEMADKNLIGEFLRRYEKEKRMSEL